jgi:hypothetical protein
MTLSYEHWVLKSEIIPIVTYDNYSGFKLFYRLFNDKTDPRVK